ncbi:unnamed protein product [Cylicocyclus nassatus]|uniref:Uncharacterized protein n=1 Tax=Cylicocyclus nassatus TaxID=53992 RepID=A0AA36H246_CYLNA|nr:unnamed protein product [Cylicocyclus nassatus]
MLNAMCTLSDGLSGPSGNRTPRSMSRPDRKLDNACHLHARPLRELPLLLSVRCHGRFMLSPILIFFIFPLKKAKIPLESHFGRFC